MLLVLAITAAFALPPGNASWAPIAATPVQIACTTWEARPYCRSTGVIGVPQARATAIFAEFDKYVARMGAITRIDRLEPDVLRIVMDYPFPFEDRDYVARFSSRTEADGAVVYAWTPVEHPNAPVEAGVLRLPKLDGEWRFAAEGGNTRVTYVWEAEAGGNLPDVGAVRTQAGTLAIRDMASACGTTVISP